MRKLILLSLTLLMLPFMFSSNLYAIDSIETLPLLSRYG